MEVPTPKRMRPSPPEKPCQWTDMLCYAAREWKCTYFYDMPDDILRLIGDLLGPLVDLPPSISIDQHMPQTPLECEACVVRGWIPAIYCKLGTVREEFLTRQQCDWLTALYEMSLSARGAVMLREAVRNHSLEPLYNVGASFNDIKPNRFSAPFFKIAGLLCLQPPDGVTVDEILSATTPFLSFWTYYLHTDTHMMAFLRAAFSSEQFVSTSSGFSIKCWMSDNNMFIEEVLPLAAPFMNKETAHYICDRNKLQRAPFFYKTILALTEPHPGLLADISICLSYLNNAYIQGRLSIGDTRDIIFTRAREDIVYRTRRTEWAPDVAAIMDEFLTASAEQ